MTIKIIIIGIEALSAGLIIGYSIGQQRGRQRVHKFVDNQTKEMQEVVEVFNDIMEDVCQKTGVELPRLPNYEEADNGRNR